MPHVRRPLSFERRGGDDVKRRDDEMCACGHTMFWHGKEHYGCLGVLDRCNCNPVTVCVLCDCGQAEARRRFDAVLHAPGPERTTP